MANRREFIVAGAVAAGGASWAYAGELTGALPDGKADIYTVVYDERFSDSVAFARRARAQGLRVSAIRGDVTKLWYDDLYHRWKRGPAAIAGLTTADAFFCLETFGVDAGLRRVLKVEHRADPYGIEHRMEGPAPLLRDAALSNCGGAWPGRMAQLVARCPASRAQRIEATAASAGETFDDGRPSLVSWVLAPVRRAAPWSA